MSDTVSGAPGLPEGTAQTVGTYLIQNTAFKQGIRYWPSDSSGDPPTVTYSFSADWTPAEQSAVTQAFGLWSWVAAINFVEAPSGQTGEIQFEKNNSGQAYHTDNTLADGSGFGPKTTGTISIDTAAFGEPTDVGGYGFTTVVHEIGHALGLGHTGAYNGSTVDPDVPDPPPGYRSGTVFLTDTRQYSIMSYNNQSLTGQNTTIGNTTYQNESPVLYDIAAAQRLYGPPVTSASGTTTFGFNASPGIPSVFDFAQNPVPVETLYSHTASNLLDLSGFADPSAVDLNSGTFSSVAGMTDNLSIDYATAINTVIGGAGDDTFTPNANQDSIDGGGGFNQATFGGTQEQYGLSMSDGTLQVATTSSSATGDAFLTNIERVNFADAQLSVAGGAGGLAVAGGATPFDITLGSGSNTVLGGGGNNTVMGGGGTALIAPGSGANTVWLPQATAQVISTGNDTVIGGAGSTTVSALGPANSDAVWGGSGRMLFANGQAASAVIRGAGSATIFGSGGGGVYAGGTAGGNTIVGGAGAAVMYGSGDGDALFAGGGQGDILIAGSGNESLVGVSSTGNDVFYAGSGSDLISAGSGNDVVFAGTGTASVFAGSGFDLFAFANGRAGGADTIAGFGGSDRLTLQGYGTGAVAATLATASVGGGALTLTLPDATRLTLVGVASIGSGAFV